MENNRKIQIYCLFAASLLIGVFGALCFFLAVTGEYNDAMGYFDRGALFAPVLYCCLAAGPVLGVVAWVLFRKRVALDVSLPVSIPVKIGSGIAAALLFFAAGAEAFTKLNTAGAVVGKMDFITWIFAVLSVAAFLAAVISNKEGKTVKPLVSLLGFAPALLCAVKVLYLYFDQSVAVNSPTKLICQLAYLSFMLVFCAEAGISLGRGRIYPRYIFALLCANTIGGSCALAAVAIWAFNAQCKALEGLSAFIMLGFFVYCAVRFVTLGGVSTEEAKKEEDTVPPAAEVFEENE